MRKRDIIESVLETGEVRLKACIAAGDVKLAVALIREQHRDIDALRERGLISAQQAKAMRKAWCEQYAVEHALARLAVGDARGVISDLAAPGAGGRGLYEFIRLEFRSDLQQRAEAMLESSRGSIH
jgi:ribosomal protein S20